MKLRLTRRQMFLSLLGAGAARMLPGCRSEKVSLQARDVTAAGHGLDPERRRALAAAFERVLPGAQEAGVPEYLDHWLAREPYSDPNNARWMGILSLGAKRLNDLARRAHQREFADCTGSEQDAILTRFQQGLEDGRRLFRSRDFFKRLVEIAMEGFLSEPRYGGNRGEVGWRFIGRRPCWWAPKRIQRFMDPRVGPSDEV